MPGGMGNPRHAMNHMQGVTLDGKNGAPQYGKGDFQSREGPTMPQQVQLEQRSGAPNVQGSDMMGDIKSFVVKLFIALIIVLGLFVLPRMSNAETNVEAAPEAAPEPAKDPLAVLDEGLDLTPEQVTESLENTLQSDFKADLGDEDRLAAFVTTAEVPKAVEGREGEGAPAAGGTEDPAAPADPVALAEPDATARDTLATPKVTADLEARLAQVTAAVKLLRDGADGVDAKLSDQYLESIKEKRAAQLAKLNNAELQLKQLQVMKERDEAIAAAKVHEKEHAAHLVCADAERHLQENYIEHYSCRFDAVNTAPNPMVAYSVHATMSDGAENDVAAEQEARKKDAATHVALDTLAVALYLEAWASANSEKLGLDEAPGFDEMAASVKAFAAQDDYKMPPPVVPEPTPAEVVETPKPAKVAVKPEPAKIVAKPADWVDPIVASVAKEADALRNMMREQQQQATPPAEGDAVGTAGQTQAATQTDTAAADAAAAAGTANAEAAAGAADAGTGNAGAAVAPSETEHLSEAEWMAKYGPQGTEGMPAPAAAAYGEGAAAAAAAGEDAGPTSAQKKKNLFGFGRRLLGKKKGKAPAGAAPKPAAVLRYADAKKGPGTFYSINVFAGKKGSPDAGVRTVTDAATVMRALHIPGIANFWGGAQPEQTHRIAARLAAYNKDGDTARFSSFQPGITNLVTAKIVDSGPAEEVSPRIPRQPVMDVAGVQSEDAPAGAESHTVLAPTVQGSAVLTGGYPLVSVVDPSLDVADAVKALDQALKQAQLPALVFASVTNCVQFAWDFSNNYPYRVYAVSPGHKGSRKAVLLRLDQDTSSPGFVKSMGADRAVTLIAVSESDSFDEWASRTGHVSCDCNKKACRAPVGPEYEAGGARSVLFLFFILSFMLRY